MSKESKSAATIRRRRHFSPGLRELTSRQHKSTHGEDNLDSDEEDPDFHQDPPIQGPPVLKLLMSSQWTLFLGLLAFRVINALMIQTSFVPDEYWQSVEVAHNMSFGYGYMTWEWRHGLRGYTYPFLFAVIYKVLGILHLDTRLLLIKLPRMLQATFAAIGDIYLYKFSRKLGGHEVAQWSLLCQLTSWFTFYCCTRTLTNSMETVLTTVALYYYPWPGRQRKAHWKYLTVVGLAIVVRPTAAILWLPLCAAHCWMWRHVAWKVLRLFTVRGFLILALSSTIDRLYYGHWINVQYNFLKFNVLSNMSTFYGSHPWHWYLTQGFAVIMGAQIFPFLLATRKALEPVLLAVIGWTVAVYSCLGHKEFRFILPVMPLAMHVCGSYLHHVTDTSPDEDNSDCEPLAKNNHVTNAKDQLPLRTGPAEGRNWCPGFWTRKQFLVVFLIATNLPLALYTSLLHQRGTIDVMKFLSDESQYDVGPRPKVPDARGHMSVLYLMPCHSTPYYSFLHRNISMRFLTCEPNLDNIPNYLDEADIFYKNPSDWLQQEPTLRHPIDNQSAPTIGGLRATHVVLFNVLYPSVSEFLRAGSYEPCATFFHSHVPEGRVGSHVNVFCKTTWSERKKEIEKRRINLFKRRGS